MADKGQRTEQPTERRIQKAREEGNFAVSKDLVSALQFAAFTALLTASSAEWFVQMRSATRFLLTSGFSSDVNANTLVHLLWHVIVPLGVPLAIGGASLMLVTVAVQLATTRIGISLKKLQPDIKRLDPLQKLKGIPRQNVPQFFQALVLLPVFLAIVYVIVSDKLTLVLSLPLLSQEASLAQLGLSIRELLWKATGLFLVVGLLDLIRKRRQYTKDLRMTKQEVRDEFKEVEGNPQIKAQVRRLQRDLLRRQMMNDVPQSTAVIVNPTHYAVAIRYEPGTMTAPRVTAKGRNLIAKRIRELAVEHEIPIVENPPLARALYKSVDVGQEIPVHLYRAVAEILAYIYRLVNGQGRRMGPVGERG